MGLGGMILSSSSYECNNPLPNPNPYNYKIKDVYEINTCIILLINYLDCTNYEGNKILLFRNCDLDDILNQRSIDPHFSNSSVKISPFARFEPTKEGLKMAKKLAKIL